MFQLKFKRRNRSNSHCDSPIKQVPEAVRLSTTGFRVPRSAANAVGHAADVSRRQRRHGERCVPICGKRRRAGLSHARLRQCRAARRRQHGRRRQDLGHRCQPQSVSSTTQTGGLLGSWTAGSMANNATPEGIATNGTDIWIVDAKSDKVFRYAGAASRLSGSQNAASSFNLNSGNYESQGHRHRRRIAVGRRRCSQDRQSLQVLHQRQPRRKLDDRLGQQSADGHRARPGQCRRHLDRRQRHRPRLQIHRCRQPQLGQPDRRRPICPGHGQHATRKAWSFPVARGQKHPTR